MWQRRSFHECASELAAISDDFRAAHTNRWGWDEGRRRTVLGDTSVRGVEVLRILALSVRGDQDYALTSRGSGTVGAFRRNAVGTDVRSFIAAYRPPYRELPDFSSLKLRDALNKIAHANPEGAGFYADDASHDLLLSGLERGAPWLAVVSIPDLCAEIRSLPDASTRR